MRWLLPLLLILGCNTPIQGGREVGPLVTGADGFTSSFALAYDGGAVLFDAGLASAGGPMADALAVRDLSLDDVTDVLVTHAHGDHVGGLGALPNAGVWIHPDEAARFVEEAPEGRTIAGVLEDGQVLTFGEHRVEVFHLPGHTDGSVAFLVSGVLVLGDSAIANVGDAFEQVPSHFSDDPEQIDRSLTALAGRLRDRADEVDWLAFSHSGPLPGLDPLLEYVDGLEE